MGITPFAEFIWTKNPNLWIRDRVPRVSTPAELRELLADPSAQDIFRNHSAAIRIVR
jgi:hypothetical protein